jgi:phage terminase large subunit-like protein
LAKSPKSLNPELPAQDVIDRINALSLTGEYAGQPFKLRPWQEAMVRPVFGTKRPDGLRQYTKVFWGLPRKQAKTTLAAALVLELLVGQGKQGQEIYSASGTQEQASLIYAAAAQMVRANRHLSSVCRCYDGFKRITHDPSNSFYDAVSSEDSSKHGLNPSAVLFDEVHVLPNRKLYNALTTGFATRREPLTIMLSTAGHDRTSLCYEIWQRALAAIREPEGDPEFFAVIHAADEGDDWTSEATWRKAMPALDDFCSLRFIRDEFNDARKYPQYENRFKQLYLNLWTEQAVRWLSVEAWMANSGTVDRGVLRGRPCYGGLDLGISGDMSAFARLFPNPDGGITIAMSYWAPRDGKWKDELRNQDRYPEWARRGILTLTRGTTTDHQKIEDDILAMNEETPIRLIEADRAYATQILSRLYNQHGMNVKGISQGPVTMNEPTIKFEELVMAGKVRHGGDPILAWNVANASLTRTTTGLVHLSKESSTERIDGLAAVLNALAAMTSEPPGDEISDLQVRWL